MRDGEDRIVGMEDIVRAHHVLREVVSVHRFSWMRCCRPNTAVMYI